MLEQETGKRTYEAVFLSAHKLSEDDTAAVAPKRRRTDKKWCTLAFDMGACDCTKCGVWRQAWRTGCSWR